MKVQYFEKHYLMTTFIKFQIISVALTLHILHRVKIILNLSTGIVEAASAVPNSKAGLFIFVVFQKMFKGGIKNVYLKGESLKKRIFYAQADCKGGGDSALSAQTVVITASVKKCKQLAPALESPRSLPVDFHVCSEPAKESTSR